VSNPDTEFVDDVLDDLIDVIEDSPGRPGHRLLPGVVQRDLRGASRGAAGRVHALLPLTPYGVAKAYGHLIVGSYRRGYGLFVCSGILYNHESWRRPVTFVSRRISRAAAAISAGVQSELMLGEFDARRDWEFAGDYVHAIVAHAPTTGPGRLRRCDRPVAQRAGDRRVGIRPCLSSGATSDAPSPARH
jgi:hypothetical protein